MTEEQIQKMKETWESALDGVFVQTKGIEQVIEVISAYRTLQQQNKQLIEALNDLNEIFGFGEVEDDEAENEIILAYKKAYTALQQNIPFSNLQSRSTRCNGREW